VVTLRVIDKSTVFNRNSLSKWSKILRIALGIVLLFCLSVGWFFKLFLRSVVGDVVQQIDLSNDANDDGTFFHSVIII